MNDSQNTQDQPEGIATGQDSVNRTDTPEGEQETGRGTNPNSLKNLRPPWPKGTSGNTKGNPRAGAAVKEGWNALADLPLADIERIAGDEYEPWWRRTAAGELLRAYREGGAALERIVSHTDGRATQRHQVAASPTIDTERLRKALLVLGVAPERLPMRLQVGPKQLEDQT